MKPLESVQLERPFSEPLISELFGQSSVSCDKIKSFPDAIGSIIGGG